MKIEAALAMKGRGASAPAIAASLGVNVRTIRKWFAKAKAEPEQAEAKEYGELALSEVYDLLRRELSRDAQALADAKPGQRAMQWQRIAKALLALASLPEPKTQKASSDEAILSELTKRLEALAAQPEGSEPGTAPPPPVDGPEDQRGPEGAGGGA